MNLKHSCSVTLKMQSQHIHLHCYNPIEFWTHTCQPNQHTLQLPCRFGSVVSPARRNEQRAGRLPSCATGEEGRARCGGPKAGAKHDGYTAAGGGSSEHSRQAGTGPSEAVGGGEAGGAPQLPFLASRTNRTGSLTHALTERIQEQIRS